MISTVTVSAADYAMLVKSVEDARWRSPPRPQSTAAFAAQAEVVLAELDADLDEYDRETDALERARDAFLLFPRREGRA